MSTNPPTPEEAAERASRALDGRTETVRQLAVARQEFTNVGDQTARELAELKTDIEQRMKTARDADKAAYNAARKAGWSIKELQQIGFPEPTTRSTPRSRRPNTRSTQKPTDHQVQQTKSSDPQTAPQSDSTPNGATAPTGASSIPT